MLNCLIGSTRFFNSFDYFASFEIGQSAKRNKYTGSRRGLLALFTSMLVPRCYGRNYHIAESGCRAGIARRKKFLLVKANQKEFPSFSFFPRSGTRVRGEILGQAGGVGCLCEE